jgi:aminoglycoside phosphotransferase (APT) family kinase protein
MSGNTLIDKAKKPREGEELDVAKLAPYLLSQIPGSHGPLAVEQFPSGHSNLTYLLKLGDRELVLRRPPFGSKVKSAHDMGREYRILSKLRPVFPYVPAALAFEESGDLMGAQFYVMERIRGVILRRNLPDELGFDAAKKRKLDEAFVDMMVNLHLLDYKAAGLGDLGKPEGYVERQVSGWTKRYEGSKTDDIPSVDQCAQWLAAKLPKEVGASLIHNDYKFDNLILDPADPTKIIGILDWEMSTLGDPLMDFGTALGYWVEEGDSDELKMISFGPTLTPGSMTRRELAERYAAKTGFDISRLDFYYVFALWKTAVVLQQIYYRYKNGLTKDERFANFIYAVQILCTQAVKVIEQSKL